MNMIERISRALVKRNYPSFTEADIDAMWEGWADDAATAIQAMRDPTPEMIAAGEAVDGTVTALPIWQAMIDAAAIDTRQLRIGSEHNADEAAVAAIYGAAICELALTDTELAKVMPSVTAKPEPIDTSFGVGEG